MIRVQTNEGYRHFSPHIEMRIDAAIVYISGFTHPRVPIPPDVIEGLSETLDKANNLPCWINPEPLSLVIERITRPAPM